LKLSDLRPTETKIVEFAGWSKTACPVQLQWSHKYGTTVIVCYFVASHFFYAKRH